MNNFSVRLYFITYNKVDAEQVLLLIAEINDITFRIEWFNHQTWESGRSPSYTDGQINDDLVEIHKSPSTTPRSA